MADRNGSKDSGDAPLGGAAWVIAAFVGAGFFFIATLVSLIPHCAGPGNAGVPAIPHAVKEHVVESRPR